MNEEKLFYTLALQGVEGVGDVTFKRLLHHFEDAEAVLKATVVELLKIEGVGEKLVTNLKSKTIFSEAERELLVIKSRGIQVTYYQEESYPNRLKHCDDGPVLLFTGRPLDWGAQRVISVVGTRNPTRRGLDFCEQLITELAAYQPIIVSGFAFGVDITAHKVAVEHGLKTVAVLGHSLLDVYPKEHGCYVRLLEESGGFMTEFKTGSKIEKENFIRRNRIIAGVSEATIVIESAIRGGSMSTARFANEYNREVFAVPGRVNDIFSQGCNELIKHNKAQLVTSTKDIVEMLQWDSVDRALKGVQKKLFFELKVEEQRIFDFLLNSEKQSMDAIAMACQIPVYKVSALLLNMELMGVIRPLPGKIFEIL